MRHIRFALGALALIAIAALITADTEVVAGGKDKSKDNDSKQEQQLRKQVASLQQDLKQASNQIDNLQRELREREQTINRLRAENKKDKNPAELRKDLIAAQQTIKDKDEQIAVLKKQAPKDTAATAKLLEDLRRQSRELDALRKTPYVHTVIVKMKKEATSDQTQALLDDIPTMLGKIPTVKGLWYGRRANQVSPEFAVKDFDISLSILFDNYDGLTRYLEHPMHKAFLDKHVKNVEAPLVYDALKPIP